MREIAIIVDNIYDEIDDAAKYADQAMQADGSTKELYLALAAEELGHADRLHQKAVDMIARAKNADKAVPAGMEEMYQFEHRRIIGKASAIRQKIDMIKRM